MKKSKTEALRAKFSAGGESSGLMLSTVSEWYDAKHRRACAEEAAFANSAAPKRCPYCGSSLLVKDGLRGGLQRRLCLKCGRRPTALAGTIFGSRKIPLSEWVECLIHLSEYHGVKTSAGDNMSAYSTGRYWLPKVFAVLADYQAGVALRGRVWIDECYVPRWKGERSSPRPGKLLSGLSRDQFCVCSAADGGRCRLELAGVGKPSGAQVIRGYSEAVAGASVIVHDGEHSHEALLAASGIPGEAHPTRETKGLPDSENPMEGINSVHRHPKGFLAEHAGHSRRDLQDWLNLFCFIWDTPGDASQKAQALIELAVKKRAKLRYREWRKSKTSGKAKQSITRLHLRVHFI